MALGYTPKYAHHFDHFDYVNPKAPKGGDLVLRGYGTFDSLNPFLLKGVSADGLNTLVFESLLERSLDEPFSEYGLLADNFWQAKDGLSATFHINPKARFSNGKPVTAEDVKFSFDTLMSDKAHPQFRIYYADVKSATVVSRLTVRFDFRKKNREMPLIVGEGIPVFSRDWLHGKAFDKTSRFTPVASGPYVVDGYQVGNFIRYRRNLNYWAKDLPVRKGMYNFNTVTYKYYMDSTVALEAFKAGDFDFFFENYSKRWARDYTGPKFNSGEIIKTELSNSNDAGMQGFVMNTRRSEFKDVRVRRALSLAFDFAWANKHLFYNQYVRCNSYFSNTDLASSGLPKGAELALLNKFRKQLPASVFTKVWHPPNTDKPGSLRKNLLKARDLLAKAGWTVQDGVLKNAKGEPFVINVLLVEKGFERIFGAYAKNLKILGIQTNYRKVDATLYQRRVNNFDFDMVVGSFPESMSPGNGLRSKFASESANKVGSDNLAGVRSPVVDALINDVINAKDRAQLVVATHALDRVLLAGEYVVPNWYINKHRIAYWHMLTMPSVVPLYYDPTTWLLKAWWWKGLKH
jgi:microcin C transport system substrate-binding protein